MATKASDTSHFWRPYGFYINSQSSGPEEAAFSYTTEIKVLSYFLVSVELMLLFWAAPEWSWEAFADLQGEL